MSEHYTILNREVSAKELRKDNETYRELRARLAPGDLVFVKVPDSWYINPINGNVTKVIQVTKCTQCPLIRRKEAGCPGQVEIKGSPQTCWGFGGTNLFYGLNPVKRKFLVFKKEGGEDA